MKQNNIFPECNVDTNLVGHIIGGYAKHKSCCNEVVKAVNNSDAFAIGIIDADKRLATMDKGFQEYSLEEKIDGATRHIAMYLHEDGKRYMFTIKPAMDKFILDAAKEQKVDMKAAGYPASLDGFKKETKRLMAASDPKLRRLFDMIADYPELRRFRNTLKYLMNKQYDADVEVVKHFFDGTLTTDNLKDYLGQDSTL